MLTAQISEEAYRGLADYAAAHDVTVTALVEALGMIIPAGLPHRLETELLHLAEEVTVERKSRRPQ